MKKLFQVKNKSVKVHSFYSGLEWYNGKSSVNLLRDQIGKEIMGFKTFKTEPISTLKVTDYYGVSLRLEVKNDFIYLKINSSIFNPYWKLENLLSSIKIKNQYIEVSKEKLSEWVKGGLLTVKFNVLKKDHGTIWSFNNNRYERQILSNLKKQTNFKLVGFTESVEDDFFVDL